MEDSAATLGTETTLDRVATVSLLHEFRNAAGDLECLFRKNRMRRVAGSADLAAILAVTVDCPDRWC